MDFSSLNANEYYDEMNLDFSTDFYNKNHVNLFGAKNIQNSWKSTFHKIIIWKIIREIRHMLHGMKHIRNFRNRKNSMLRPVLDLKADVEEEQRNSETDERGESH